MRVTVETEDLIDTKTFTIFKEGDAAQPLILRISQMFEITCQPPLC